MCVRVLTQKWVSLFVGSYNAICHKHRNSMHSMTCLYKYLRTKNSTKFLSSSCMHGWPFCEKFCTSLRCFNITASNCIYCLGTKILWSCQRVKIARVLSSFGGADLVDSWALYSWIKFLESINSLNVFAPLVIDLDLYTANMYSRLYTINCKCSL